MREALALGNTPRHIRGVQVVVCLTVVLLGVGLGAFAATSISVDSLQVGIVESTSQIDRTSLGLDKAVVGDKVRVSALVSNGGSTAVGELEVDFFFTETISGEHGRLGTQTVSGLEPGESKRPVVVFDTSAFSPGIYAFSAEVDPRSELGDTATCDNAAPRGACAGSAEESPSKYSLTLLREGRHISPLTISGSYPVCRMGKLDYEITVSVHNVGTETLSSADLVVYGYYRQGFSPPADEFVALAEDTSGSPIQLSKIASIGEPGEPGSIFISLSYTKLAEVFAPSNAERLAGDVLGRSDPVQIRITVQPSGGGAPQDLFLPAQFELAQFYSTVDLWTYPQRTACCSADCAAVAQAEVPAVAGGLVFHVTHASSGDALHVLRIATGEEKEAWPAPAGKTLTAPVAFYDEDSGAYRVFVGASDGRVYALEGIDKEEEGAAFLADLWQSAAADQAVKGTTHLVLSANRTKVIVGSESGAFVLDAATGQTARKVTNRGAVTSAPTYVDATGELWFAAGDLVYRISTSGSECSYDVGEQITTDLARNFTGTAIFFGTETGSVYAVGSSCQKLADDRPLRSVVGIAVASDSDDAVVFLTSDIGEMARAEYDHNRDFDVTISQREVEPDAVGTAPALLLNASGDDALAVFVSGLKREGKTNRPILQACDRNLEELEDVTVWGTSVPFIFKPKEDDAVPDELLRLVVDPDWFVLLVVSSDGYLYAFDLGQYE